MRHGCHAAEAPHRVSASKQHARRRASGTERLQAAAPAQARLCQRVCTGACNAMGLASLSAPLLRLTQAPLRRMGDAGPARHHRVFTASRLATVGKPAGWAPKVLWRRPLAGRGRRRGRAMDACRSSLPCPCSNMLMPGMRAAPSTSACFIAAGFSTPPAPCHLRAPCPRRAPLLKGYREVKPGCPACRDAMQATTLHVLGRATQPGPICSSGGRQGAGVSKHATALAGAEAWRPARGGAQGARVAGAPRLRHYAGEQADRAGDHGRRDRRAGQAAAAALDAAAEHVAPVRHHVRLPRRATQRYACSEYHQACARHMAACAHARRASSANVHRAPQLQCNGGAAPRRTCRARTSRTTCGAPAASTTAGGAPWRGRSRAAAPRSTCRARRSWRWRRYSRCRRRPARRSGRPGC